MLRSAIVCLCWVFLQAPASASVIFQIKDAADDRDAIMAVRKDRAVQSFGKRLKALDKRFRRLKARDFVSLFGKSLKQPKKGYAMPVAQSRWLVLSGLRHIDPKKNKDRIDFYRLGPSAGLRVYFSIDGVSPAAFVFFLRIDKAFVRLKNGNLSQRLAWERQRFQKALGFVQKRWPVVFPWRVDRKREAHLFRGEYARTAKGKLKAWLTAARRTSTCRLTTSMGRATYLCHRADGTLARKAVRYAKNSFFHIYVWYHPDGRSEHRREEFFLNRKLRMWRWSRPGGKGQNIRFEVAGVDGQPKQWWWYDNQGMLIRKEWDDNGDGIPDWYDTTPIATMWLPKLKPKRLKLSQSWAVHPKLIPAQSRINDQPQRCVYIQKRRAKK